MIVGVCNGFGAVTVVGTIGDGRRGLVPRKALNLFKLSAELSLILFKWEVI